MRTKLTTTIMITLFLASLLGTIFGVSSANAAITGGKFGDALEFDGVDDYVMVSDSSSLRLPSTEVTVEAWIYVPSNLSLPQYIVRKWIDADGGFRFSYSLSVSENGAIVGGMGNIDLGQHPVWIANQTITDLGINDTWAHVAFTWKKEAITGADGHIFVNGLGVNTTFDPHAYSAAFTIGYGNYPLYLARKVDSSWSNYYFKGALDEIRISNVSRTTFNLTSAPAVDADTVALWHFDEGTGLTAHDASANANDGTIFGATWTGVIPEFPSVLILPLFVVTSLLAVMLYKRKRPESFEG